MTFTQHILAHYKIISRGPQILFDQIRKEVYSPSFFKKWLADCSLFREDDIHQRFGVKEDAPKKDFEEAGKEYLRDLFTDFEENFYEDAEEEGGKLVAFRCIAMDNVKEFIRALKKGGYVKGYDGLGIYWSWDKDAAECHSGSGKYDVTVKALIPPQSIDVKRTAAANMHVVTGIDEKELTLKEGAKLLVVAVLDAKGKNLLDEAMTLPAVAEF